MIYKPKGRAQEYAESAPGANDGYAINLYKGCKHSCAYCYVPSQPPWRFSPTAAQDFHEDVKPFPNALNRIKRACHRLGDIRNNPLHLCFTCDPYPAGLKSGDDITKEVLLMLSCFGFVNVQVLTKGGIRAERDFDIFQLNKGWKFGSTVLAVSDGFYNDWDSHGLNQLGYEPGADSMFHDREAAIQVAHEMGIFTWVSLEPVIYPKEALEVIFRLGPYVDLWKIGKLNHGAQISPQLAAIEKETNWAAFVKSVKARLQPEQYMLKKSLKVFENNG